MNEFIGYGHYSITTTLGPNERFGIADEMEFQDYVLALQARKECSQKNKKLDVNISFI